MKEKEKRGEREEEGVKIGRPTIGRRSSDLIFFFFKSRKKKMKRREEEEEELLKIRREC